MTFEEKLQTAFELLREKDIDAALDQARILQKEQPSAPEPYHLEAQIMLQLNQWDLSVKLLNKAIELNPGECAYYNHRGFAYLQKEQFKQAESDFEEAISIADSSSAHRNKVMVMIATERGNEAVMYLIDRIRKNPRDIENWILMGDMMRKAGQEEKAKGYYEQALKMDPENDYVQRQLEA